jgi:hypothetical protein
VLKDLGNRRILYGVGPDGKDDGAHGNSDALIWE